MSLKDKDWRDFVHSDHLQELQADEEFQLTAPEGQDDDESSLGEQTTNDGFGSSIEIKLISATADAMERLDRHSNRRWTNIPEKTHFRI